MVRDYPNVETVRLSDDEKSMLTLLSKRSGVSRAEVVRKLIHLATELTEKYRPISEIIQLAEEFVGGMMATEESVATT